MDAVGGSGYGRLISGIRLDLLTVLGDEYIYEYFLSAYEKELKEKLYCIYITDSLFAISQGKSMNIRYIDALENKQEERSADEIKGDIKSRLNGMR